MIIGLISDTHGRFPDGLASFLNGCDWDFHAGDVTADWLLAELRAFAPIAAVRGNNDHAMDTPPALVRRIGGLTLAAVHALGSPSCPAPALGALLDEEASPSPDLVLHGHTHVPSVEAFGGRLYVNPGSAGGFGRGGRASTVARVELAERAFTLRFFEVVGSRLLPFGEVVSRPLGAPFSGDSGAAP